MRQPYARFVTWLPVAMLMSIVIGNHSLYSQSDWGLQENAIPPNAPLGIQYGDMAYCPNLGMVIYFGGRENPDHGPEFDRTWAWDGVDWIELLPGVSPTSRYNHRMVTNWTTGEVVLFGGQDPPTNNFLGDTWSFDGSTWRQVQGASAPSPRSNTALAYDPLRDRVVLFGGLDQDSGSRDLQDTWEFDGVDWHHLSPSLSPPGRAGGEMAFDPVSSSLIMFGGGSYANFRYSDTWSWDGSTWAERTSSGGPVARSSHDMCRDDRLGQVILIGGQDGSSGSTATYHNDTWAWDGSAWYALSLCHAPSPRSHHRMAYDPIRGYTVLYGGHEYPVFNVETWILSELSYPAGRPIAYWNFDEQFGPVAIDLTGNGHDLELRLGASRSPGVIGTSSLNTRSGYAVAPNSPDLALPGSYTVSAWIKHDAWHPGSMHTFAGMHSCTVDVDHSWIMNVYEDRIFFQEMFSTTSEHIYGSDGAYLGQTHYPEWGDIGASATLPVNEWNHIVATYDDSSGMASIYANGALLRRGPWASTTGSSLARFTVGTNHLLPDGVSICGSNSFFQGDIDELIIYDYALDDCSVQALYSVSLNHDPQIVLSYPANIPEGSSLTLDASTSFDPDLDPLTFTWEQIAGPTITGWSAQGAVLSFDAPYVPIGGATLTLLLTVSDGQSSATELINVTVDNVNHEPESLPSAPPSVNEGSQIVLDGEDSWDQDDDPLVYLWTSAEGLALTSATSAVAMVTAPLVGQQGLVLHFTLHVSDGELTSSTEITVLVENVNHPPVALAGDDQTKDEDSCVSLIGAGADPDADQIAPEWSPVSGPPVTLSDPHAWQPTFTAPRVAPGGEDLVFQLVVSDYELSSPPDLVTIHVRNIYDPPDCTDAVADPCILWPPNHKLREIDIKGVVDPNNDFLSIAFTGITQDEPTNGIGDGDTGPDAVIQDDKLFLRAERSGTGNGRVYQVSFTASDGNGGFCSGTVSVIVPHRRKKVPAVDDGQAYNSML